MRDGRTRQKHTLRHVLQKFLTILFLVDQTIPLAMALCLPRSTSRLAKCWTGSRRLRQRISSAFQESFPSNSRQELISSRPVVVKDSVVHAYNKFAQETLKRCVWSKGCHAWYNKRNEGADNTVTAMYPGSVLHFKGMLAFSTPTPESPANGLYSMYRKTPPRAF